MFYEQHGIALWYGTSDAPAPGEEVTAGANGTAGGISVTVGVKPIAARNSVRVHFRINAGASATVAASLARTDIHNSSQYFVAALPQLRTGDRVEYTAVLSAPGVQVAAGGDPTKLPSSFRVV